jgi:hypothetical protein
MLITLPAPRKPDPSIAAQSDFKHFVRLNAKGELRSRSTKQTPLQAFVECVRFISWGPRLIGRRYILEILSDQRWTGLHNVLCGFGLDPRRIHGLTASADDQQKVLGNHYRIASATPGGAGAASQPWIPKGERSGLLTPTATTAKGLSFVAKKS